MKLLFFVFIFLDVSFIFGKRSIFQILTGEKWLKVCEQKQGNWQKPQEFSNGSYACGVKVINENPEVDSSINGISFLICSQKTKNEAWKKIIGSDWGNWKKEAKCPAANYIAGFQVKVANFKWDTNASWDGLKILCQPSNTWIIAEDGKTGKWQKPVVFSSKKVCGVQVKTQPAGRHYNIFWNSIHFTDDGLNGLNVKLCI